MSVFKRSLIGVIALLLLGGCGKKAVRTGIPFSLDTVFVGVASRPQESLREKGIRLAKEKDFDAAIEAFQNHVLQEPNDFFGFNALAVCYKNLGDHAKAMKNYERALEFAQAQEDRAKVLANIGNLYFSADKPQVALGYYKEAASEFTKNPLYLVFIARAFVVLNEPERARKVLAEVERVHDDLERYESEDDRGLGSYHMAYSFLALNEEDKVFKYLEDALKANPSKYVTRLETDFSDEKSLWYTLKDEPKLKKVMRRYAKMNERSSQARLR